MSTHTFCSFLKKQEFQENFGYSIISPYVNGLSVSPLDLHHDNSSSAWGIFLEFEPTLT